MSPLRRRQKQATRNCATMSHFVFLGHLIFPLEFLFFDDFLVTRQFLNCISRRNRLNCFKYKELSKCWESSSIDALPLWDRAGGDFSTFQSLAVRINLNDSGSFTASQDSTLHRLVKVGSVMTCDKSPFQLEVLLRIQNFPKVSVIFCFGLLKINQTWILT